MAGLETTRLLLRPWSRADLDPLAEVFAHVDVWRYPLGRGLTREQTERFLDRQMMHWGEYGFGLWAAELKESSTLIGYIGLAVPHWLPQILPAVEVGYRLHPRHWGKGIATEGAEASLRHGFTMLGLTPVCLALAMVVILSGDRTPHLLRILLEVAFFITALALLWGVTRILMETAQLRASAAASQARTSCHFRQRT